MWRSRSSLEFLIGCIKKQVNPRRKRCAAAVTLFVPYYFYPMKFPALKICENLAAVLAVKCPSKRDSGFIDRRNPRSSPLSHDGRAPFAFAILPQLFEATSHFPFLLVLRNLHNFAKRGVTAIP
ncbi:unnamed protein product [Lasius platythorax]|uniref:Uncharacterized protein n=1 Tax=Lasius platythorax TaxID=488582 RepID=A0AAV2N2D0_9HYME